MKLIIAGVLMALLINNTTIYANETSATLQEVKATPKIDLLLSNEQKYTRASGLNYLKAVPRFDLFLRGENGIKSASILLNNKLIYTFNSQEESNKSLVYNLNLEPYLPEEGYNRLEITLADSKGNKTNHIEEFYLDSIAPSIKSVSINGNRVKLADTMEGFHLLLKDAATMEIEAFDNGSEVSNIVATYYGENKNKEREVVIPFKDKSRLTIPSGFKGFIKIIAIDKVGNKSTPKITEGIISGSGTQSGTLSLSVDSNSSANNQIYYKPVNVNLSAIDEVFGLDTISYKIISSSGITKKTINTNKNKYTTSIPVPIEGSNVEIVANMKNKLGENIEKSIELNVDLTAPVIKIKNIYNNSANRSTVMPKVIISDENLNLKDCSVSIVRSDGRAVDIPQVVEKGDKEFTVSFEDFSRKKEYDGIYTLSVKASDMAGHTSNESISFSVNRYGSTYAFSSQTENLCGKYNKEANDITLIETNVDSIDPDSIVARIVLDGKPTTLKLNKDFYIREENVLGGWKKYTYTIPKEKFKKNGSYNVLFSSKDKAGNINDLADENSIAKISFGIDSAAPIIDSSNLTDNLEVEEDSLECKLAIRDNISLESVEVMVDGVRTDYKKSADEYSFILSKDENPHKVEVKAFDIAGNECVKSFSNILVKGSPVLVIPEELQAAINTSTPITKVYKVIEKSVPNVVKERFPLMAILILLIPVLVTIVSLLIGKGRRKTK